jgi:hypothetical protein
MTPTPSGPVYGIKTILQQRDIDTTQAALLRYFFYQFLPYIPSTILADPRKLIKHIKDFYLSRGSEGSYKLLFQILFNDSVGFYYPRNDIMIVDGGNWSVDTIIRTTTTNNTYEFIGRIITGVTSGATAAVENVVQFQIGSDLVSEIYISGLKGVFDIGETVKILLPNNVTVQETTYGLATGIDLTYPGTAYQSDDIITVTGSNTTAIFSVNISGGTAIGRVVQATFNNYPQQAAIQLASSASTQDGYYNNMFITITDGSGNGQIKQITNYYGITQVALVDTNWLTLPDYTSHYSIALGNIKTIKVKDFGINYSTSIPANFTLSGNGDAIGNIIVGAVGQYAGRFVNDDSFIDWRKYLEDDYYYQYFSYVLKSHESLNQYENVVKQNLHPAGLLMFGDILIDSVPFVRKSHAISGTIAQSTSGGVLPSGATAQYSMLETVAYPQTVFDDSSAYPNGYNGFLGSTTGTDLDDPSWISTGVQFLNTFVTDYTLPVSNSAETLIVVAKANVLSSNGCVMGNIDTNNDSGVSGYQIIVNVDGSISFRTQKINGIKNNLQIQYPPGSINTSEYFFASLRYLNNTIVGNLNQLSSIVGSFGYNVDNTLVSNNSRGMYFGIGGYHRGYAPMVPIYGDSLYGDTLTGIPGTYSLPGMLLPGYFNGNIAYVVAWERFLSDAEVSNAYQYLKSVMVGRGIPLY